MPMQAREQDGDMTSERRREPVKAIDVLCVGLATHDLVMTIDHHPGADEKCFASSLLSCGGGPAANAAVTVSRLAGRSAFAGCLGRDVFGDEHHRELLSERVDTGWVVRRAEPTPLSVILVKPDGNRSVACYKSATAPLKISDINPAEHNPLTMLFDGHEPTLSIALGQIARRRGIPTVLDAGSVHQGTVELLPHTDYLVASATFARQFTGQSNMQAAAEILSRHAPFVVVTLGGQGLIWRLGAQRGKMPAFRVEAVDTTGAGDTFHGAFALAIARGLEFSSAMRIASAAGALCCTRLGARPAIPTLAELNSFLNSRGLRSLPQTRQ